MIQKAYEQGVKDGQEKYSLPHTLTKEHLAEIFQIKISTVNKLIARPSFPKLKDVQARYPRNQVLAWIEDNSTWVRKNTGYYDQVI